MQHLTEEEMQELRAALDGEKVLLEEELGTYGRKVGDDWQGATAGFNENEPDEIDAADKMEELSVNIPLVEELEKRYKEILAALKRMDSDKYGVTENGEPIDIDRLRANPAAMTNIKN